MHRAVLVLALLGIAGCGQPSGLELGASGGGSAGSVAAGFPVVATKNTTRVTGSDAATDAAAVAVAVYPSQTPASRPQTVALADGRDWRAALAASVLMSQPLRAPLLLTDGGDLPPATSAALDRLRPAQIVRVGGAASPGGARTASIGGSTPYAVAANVAAYIAAARRSPDNRVVIVSADAPKYAMGAAAWAAKSGDPILFVTRSSVPPQTRDAIARLVQPQIYLLGPGAVIGKQVVTQLRALGTVKRIAGRDPVTTAIAFARYGNRTFGWGVVNPGHGLVFANDRDPTTAAAAAALSASGTYGPLLVVDSPGGLPGSLSNYLATIQPGYVRDPARGVYNHGWLIGDEHAISLATAAEIDALLEIVPVSGTP